MGTSGTRMTTEEFLALPDDGIERWLIDGRVKEFGRKGRTRSASPLRDRFHSRALIRLAKYLDNWLDEQPSPRGQILGGEAGVIISHDPETMVGIDVVYVSANVLERQSATTNLVDGTPTLAVEILSPNDTIGEIHEKIRILLRARVPLVWAINPRTRTVMVHRLDAEPELFNVRQELSGEPQLPGFRVPVARLFE